VALVAALASVPAPAATAVDTPEVAAAPGRAAPLVVAPPARVAPPAAAGPVAHAPAAPPAADDPAARALLEALSGRLAGASFFAAGELRIDGPVGPRRLELKIHHRAPDRWLVHVDGLVREKGTTLLLTPDGVSAWFPRAGMTLDLPLLTAAHERLLGSDLCLADLPVLAGAVPETVSAHLLGDEFVEGETCRHLVLQAPATSGGAHGTGAGEADLAAFLSAGHTLHLWLGGPPPIPRRLEVRDGSGRVLRRLQLQGREGDLPARWIAETFAPRPGRTVLELRGFERDPPVDASLFTREGLGRWR
jgi:hypothetical protein